MAKIKFEIVSAERVVYSDDVDIVIALGIEGCREPGMVWLTDSEWQDYQAGERIFDIPNRAVRIGVA